MRGYWRGESPRSPTAVSVVNLRRVVGFLTPYRVRFALILATVGVEALLGLAPALLIRTIIDSAIGGGERGLLAVLSGALVAAAAASGLVGVLRSYLNTVVSQRIMFDLKVGTFRRLQSLSLRWFTNNRTGEVMSRLTSDISGINDVISGTLISIISNVIVLTSTLVTMAALSWQLTVLSLIVLPWAILPTLTVGRLRRRLRRERQRLNTSVSAHMQESLGVSGFLPIKSFAREEQVLEQFTAQNRGLMDLQVREALVGRWFFMLLALVTTGGPALIYWYGGGQVISGALTLGTIVGFVALIGRLYNPATALMSLHVDVMTSMAYFERIFQYLDLEPEIADAPGARELPPVVGHIRFDEVTLEYLPGQRALEEVSLEVEPGQLVALVGPSGAGKTSMTYLVPRFYEPTRGRVLVDGHLIQGVTLESLRRQIGIVTQETFLFHTSLRDNLLFARPDATQEELEAACRAAYIHEVIEELPDGYDTVVGERGYRLSGGEKQRLAIARVVLKAPRIFLLDEATSSLDTHSERAIQAALGLVMRGSTSIVIAHRLSTILTADLILYLDGGRILERGSHKELLARDGLYARLYREQLQGAQRSLEPVGGEGAG